MSFFLTSTYDDVRYDVVRERFIIKMLGVVTTTLLFILLSSRSSSTLSSSSSFLSVVNVVVVVAAAAAAATTTDNINDVAGSATIFSSRAERLFAMAKFADKRSGGGAKLLDIKNINRYVSRY